MGSVDIAVLKKPGFRRLFAVKRLRPELVEDERAKAMLLEEGRIAGQLQHPNIVPVVDVGEDAQGPYLVMDLVPGIPLGDLIRWARAAKTKLDVQLVLRLIRDAARGLHAAHELKDQAGKELALVHRDVSPQNVLVGFDGIARVTDFGIAKVLDRERETTHGLLKGKTGYMAPEQLRFEAIDRRADLFSLGVVLYELLAADRLYRGKDLPETARLILHAPPPDIGAVRKDVPPEIVELLFELLAKDREVRPPTAKDVETRLEAAINALAQENGAFDVEAFLKSELADRFEETTQWSRLLDAPIVFEGTPTDPSPRPAGARVAAAHAAENDGPTARDALETTEGRRRPSTRTWAYAAGAIALVALVALAWSLVGSGATSGPVPETEGSSSVRGTETAPAAERDEAVTAGTAAEPGGDEVARQTPTDSVSAPEPEPTSERATDAETATRVSRPPRRGSRPTKIRRDSPEPRGAGGDEEPW